MRRWLLALLAVLALGTSIPTTVSATAPTTPPTEPQITLAGGKSLTECISANPKPGCTTRRETDGHQVAVLAVLAAGITFVGWRISRGVRRNRRQVDERGEPTNV